MLNPSYTVSVDVIRPFYDSRGNRTNSTPRPLTAVVSIQDALNRPRLGEVSENRFIQDGVLYVRRGTDVEPGDEVTYNGVKFIVAGHARNDQVHPFTGDDLGWVEYRMQGFG